LVYFPFLYYQSNTGVLISVIGFVGVVFVLKHFEEILGYQWKDLAFGVIGASIWMLVVGVTIIWKTNNDFIEIGKKGNKND
jgi:hypothetical protein